MQIQRIGMAQDEILLEFRCDKEASMKSSPKRKVFISCGPMAASETNSS